MHVSIINSRLGTASFGPVKCARQTPLVLKRIIEYAIAVVFEIKVGDLRSSTRGTAETAFARQVAMYLAHVSCGLSFTDIGRIFHRDRTTVAHACGLIEDRRDDARVDRTLDLLEAVVGRLAHVTLLGSSRLN
jgi:chromosomal replication initiation ATPase DnaA